MGIAPALARPEPHLHGALGGPDVDGVRRDPRLNANPHVDDAHHKVTITGFKYLVTEQLGEATGGPQRYTGRGMREAHAALQITGPEWAALMDDLDQTLNHFQMPAREHQEIVAIIQSTRGDIVVSEEPLHERPHALAM